MVMVIVCLKAYPMVDLRCLGRKFAEICLICGLCVVCCKG